MSRIQTVLGAAILAVLTPIPGLALPSAAPIAEEQVTGSALALIPRVAYREAVLRVAGPAGYELERRFASGEPVRVDLLSEGRVAVPGRPERSGGGESPIDELADGRYRYDLLLALPEGDTRQVSGLFFVEAERAVSRDAVRGRLAAVREELAAARGEGAGRETVPELNIDDYVIVGDALDDGMTYLVLDSDDALGSTLEYWSLVNQTGDLSIRECQNQFPPDCQRTTLFMADESSGRTGIGTTAPNSLAQLHVRGDTTGLMVLDEADTGTALWVGASGGRFLIDSIDGATEVGIDDATGDFGIGTFQPQEALHVLGQAGTTKVLVEERAGPPIARELFKLQNNGGPFFIFADSSLEQSWSFAMGATGDFIQSHQQSPGVELRLTAAGNLRIEGILTEGSSREIKERVAPVDGREVLAQVAELPIARWSYRVDEEGARHLGPMAEDFRHAFGLGASGTGIAALDTAGVALAAIQGLNAEVSEKERRIAELEKRNAELGERLRAIELRGCAGGEPSGELLARLAAVEGALARLAVSGRR